MIQQPALLTLTVTAAIFLFAVKEVLGLWWQKQAERRRLHAIKTLVCRELELNNYVIKSLRGALFSIRDTSSEKMELSASVESTVTGAAAPHCARLKAAG